MLSEVTYDVSHVQWCLWMLPLSPQQQRRHGGQGQRHTARDRKAEAWIHNETAKQTYIHRFRMKKRTDSKSEMPRERVRDSERQADKQTRQSDRQSDTDRQTETGRQTEGDGEADEEGDREADGEADRQAKRQAYTRINVRTCWPHMPCVHGRVQNWHALK